MIYIFILGEIVMKILKALTITIILILLTSCGAMNKDGNIVSNLVSSVTESSLVSSLVGSSNKESSMFNSVVGNVDKWNDKLDQATNGESSTTKRAVYDFLGQDSVDVSTLDVQKICDQILNVVGQSPAIELKDEIVSLRKEKSRIEKENDNLKENYYLAAGTEEQEQISAKLEANFTKIEGIETKIGEKKEEIKAIFEKDGVTLSDKEVEVITGESYGNDVLTLSVVSINITSVLKQYKENILEQEGAVASFNLYIKYYKLYRLVVLAQERALELSLDNIGIYKGKLRQLYSDNEGLIANTLKQIETNSSYATHYKANLKSQELNKTVMNNFMSILDSYKDIWTEKYQELSILEDMVVNTINTANVSKEVSTLLGDSLNIINSLDSVDLGEILVFDNSGLETQFQELSSKLSES